MPVTRVGAARCDPVKRVDGTEEYKYDLDYNAAGDISSVKGTWQEGDPLEEGAVQHDFLYDSGGRLSSLNMSLKQGSQLEANVLRLDYGYDNSGRLASISLGGGTHAVSLQRDTMGRLETVNYSVDTGAGLEPKARAVYTYNDLHSWLTGIEVGTPDPNGGLLDTAVLDLGHSHDLAGRIVRIEEGTAFAREFGYDDMSRLTGAADYDAAEGGALLRTFGYTYNKVGERREKTLGTSTESYDWDSHGVLSTVTGGSGDRNFTFDLAGNLLNITPAAGQPTFTYDSSGRVTEVLAGDPQAPDKIVQYRYGPDERRVYRNIDGVITRYFSDGLVTYEIDGASGEPQRAYVFMPDGFTPVMLVFFGWDEGEQKHVVSAVYFYHNDHLSTPRALTNQNGTVVWRARYAPFGATSLGGEPEPLATGGIGIEYYPPVGENPVEQPLRFPGQWDDGVPGVWYNWHRFYLPDYGMYGRRDPIPAGAHTGLGAGFGYVEANPVRFSDQKGLYLDEWAPGGAAGITYVLGPSVDLPPTASSSIGFWEFVDPFGTALERSSEPRVTHEYPFDDGMCPTSSEAMNVMECRMRCFKEKSVVDPHWFSEFGNAAAETQLHDDLASGGAPPNPMEAIGTVFKVAWNAAIKPTIGVAWCLHKCSFGL